MIETESIVERIPSEKCKWHKQFQNKIIAIKNLKEDHKGVEMTEEASKASNEWNELFVEGNESKIWN